MYKQIVTAVGRMWPCSQKSSYIRDPVIYYGFDSNLTNSFPYIVPSCDTIQAIRDCFNAVNTPISEREKRLKPEKFKKYSELFSTASKDLAELYFFGFTNVCYREDNPAVRCLEFVNFGLNHNYKRCVRYDLDESKLKRYQFFDVSYFNISNAIEEFAINKFFNSLRANYSEFLQYVEEREKYTETLKRKNALEKYIQMNNETNECFSTAECDFPFRNRYTRNDDVQIHCDCFKSIRNCLHRINTTLPNYRANRFFISNGEFGCYKEDYPIIKCLEYGYSYIIKNSYIGYKEKIKRCVRYDIDDSKPKQYQKFDVPFFYNSKDPKEFNFNNVVTMRYDIRSMLVAFIKLVAKIDITFWFL